MTDVKVVAPMNMGTRLEWDEDSKQCNVNVDWTGWQIANASEVTQFIVEENFGSDNPANVWVRQNTSGLNVDPSLGVYHEDKWTYWVRVSNVA